MRRALTSLHDAQVNYLLVADSARPVFEPPAQTTSGLPVVAIIGAGFIGLSAAMRFGQLNRLQGSRFDVVLLESGFVASGPTGKSGGHICGLQASATEVVRHCGPALAARLQAHSAAAADLVRALARTVGDAIDLRDGYLKIERDGSQTISHGTDEFSIAPYPLALALAERAHADGVAVRQHSPVSAIVPEGGRYRIEAASGPLLADHVVACAGTAMARSIPQLAPLGRMTSEIRVGTIITEPIPQTVIDAAFPGGRGENLAFADGSPNVAYGSFDTANRLHFGACATLLRRPSGRKIAARLKQLAPALFSRFAALEGRPLQWRLLVDDERLCFTPDELPNLGMLNGDPGLIYANGLGGHGIAIGTLLGRAIADKIWGGMAPNPVFDDFAAVAHSRVSLLRYLRRIGVVVAPMLSR